MKVYHLVVSVYVEIVLVNNFAVDFLLCISTQIVRRKRIKVARAVIASLIGAVIATLYAISPKCVQIVIKIALAPIIALFMTKPVGNGIKGKIVDYICSTICFCLLTYFVGGMVYGIGQVIGVNLSNYIALALVAFCAIFCVLVCHAIMRKRAQNSCKKPVRIEIDGEKIQTYGLCDSGNLLVDSVSGLPIAILSCNLSSSLERAERVGYVCVNTVNGESQMPLVAPKSIYVDGKQEKALLAISNQKFGDCGVILQNSMF